MELSKKHFVLDGCLYADGPFKGCSEAVLESGLNAFFLTLPLSHGGFVPAVRAIGSIYRLADQPHHKVYVARSYHDLLQNDGRKAIILTFQDPCAIENSLDQLRVFYELGVRVVQLTYNQANYIATGCNESKDRGLTDFGREIVQEMNHLGMLIDLSHCSKQTALDVLAASHDPVVFSHAGVKNITDSLRNKSDQEIKLLADKGGVLGVTPWGPLCWKPCKAKQPTLDDYLDHVDYIVNLVGIDHVGFGSDNTIDQSDDTVGIVEQASRYPSVVGAYNQAVGVDPKVRHVIGLDGVWEIENIAQHMKKRGYSEDDIAKFLGGNFMRVIKQVWKV